MMMNKTTELSIYNKVDFWLTANNDFAGIAPIDHLFNRLDGIYVGKWRAAFSSDSSIKNWRDAWAEAIIEEGLTPNEIKKGIKECRKLYDWPPSFTEFLKACKPSIDYETAYYEAVKQLQNRKQGTDKWTDSAIFWAASRMSTDINSQPFINIKSRWRTTIDEIRKEITEGKTPNHIPEKKNELPAPGKTTVSKEESKKRFAEIYNILKKKVIRNKPESEPKINDGKYF
jgi:hypothetical protein